MNVIVVASTVGTAVCATIGGAAGAVGWIITR